MVTVEQLRKMALSFPGVEEGTCFGTLAFRVRKKFLARLRDNDEVLVLKIDFELPEILMAADPETFFTTDHYRGHPSVLIRLKKIDRRRLRDVFKEGWIRLAPKKLATDFRRAKS